MKTRWYQDEATTALMESLRNDECHPVVVAPTGSGKTIIICDFVDKYLTNDPRARILVLSHIKEILEQDYDALCDYFDLDMGLYSAGMESRTIKKITVAGIQSVYRKPELFYDTAIVIIDECHLVTIRQNGMYRKFLSQLDAQFVGFTATHFRHGHGYIHRGDGALFNEIAYNISSPANFSRLVEEGYLTKMIPKQTNMEMNVDRVKVRAGDFALDELSTRFDRNTITNVAVDEIIEYGQNYKKWLVFAIDIDHAEHITNTLINKGVEADVVHSKMEGDRDRVVTRFRQGKIRAVVNVDILTTGLDVPDIDLIAMLRPTMSPVVHVQTIGRGLRVADGKDHCLVLDFAGNTARLGPINDVQIRARKKGQKGRKLVKVCPNCKALQAPASKFCDVCGYEFKFLTKLSTTASTAEVVRTTKAEWHFVSDIRYNLHEKQGRPTSLKVTYRVGLQTFNEWVCYDHDGYAKRKANNNWVQFRAQHGMPMPRDVHELYEWSPWLKRPVKILVNFQDKFPQIKDAKFGVDWSLNDA
jgi:DNA repair protein RadD